MKKLIILGCVTALCLCLTACVNSNSNINPSSPEDIDPFQSQDDEINTATNSIPPVSGETEPKTPTTESSTSSNLPEDVNLTTFSQQLLSNYTLGITTTNNDTGEVRTSLMILDPNNESDKLVIDNYYAGLTDLTLQQCLVCINNFTTVESELVLVQTSDIDDVNTVEDIFQTRIDYMVGDGNGPGGAWYPEPTEIWKNNSRIVSNGTYVMFIVHPTKCDDIVGDFNALF